MKEPITMGNFMTDQKNIKRLVVSGLRASAAAHPGCVDLTKTQSMANSLTGRLIDSWAENPTDDFVTQKSIEHVFVKGVRGLDGVMSPVLGGSIAKRLRMAVMQSYESRVRGIDTSGNRVYNASDMANLSIASG